MNTIKKTYIAILAIIVSFFCIFEPLNAVKAYAAEGVVINLHYEREDGDYAPWSVWFWESGKDGIDNPFVEINGEMVASFSVTPGTTSVGFIVRTKEWAKDWPEDQFIDISEMVSGTVDVYVKAGIEGFTKEYGTDAVKGVKVKNAKYDGKNSVKVTMTEEIGNYAEAFILTGQDGEIPFAAIVPDGTNAYRMELVKPLDNFKEYSITYEGTEYKIIMKNIYSTEEFEKEYTYEGTDLGVTRYDGKTIFKVWAPTAESLSVNLYEGGDARMKDLIESVPMSKVDKGVWTVTIDKDLKGTYYTYTAVRAGKKAEACDPYARTTGVNGDRAMVIDLSETNPEGWAEDTNPNAGRSITDAIIYEGHIRDLTVGDTGITAQGKFMGLTEHGTVTSNGVVTGLDYIKDLGITHLHLLPVYDFGSVDELKSVTGIYNWGYDPVNYNVPEGSYSTDATNGEVRVREMKEMVKSLHESGISVVMDVVYNHVYNADKFCFNRLVPGYFSRITDEGTYSNGSGCGNDTASERTMVRKYIVDSVNYWADEYHIDGFRFDLVGLLDVDTINEIVSTVHAKHPDVIFYGEGWSMTTLVTKDDVLMATQVNSDKTPGFAYFNDTIRDGIKGSVFDKGCGFVSGAKGYDAKIARCFTGSDNWCNSPTQTVNYASCHDNNTLIDRLTLSRPEASREDLIKMNNLSASIYMLSQGVPFLQAGEEMLRSKVNADGTFNENSYAAGDKVNAINYAALSEDEYRAVYDYYRTLITLRKEHPIFRLTDASDISAKVKEVKLGTSSTLAYDIDCEGTGDFWDRAYIVFNATEEVLSVELPEGEWHVEILNGKEKGATVEGTANVDGLSAMVLSKGEKTSENGDISDEIGDEGNRAATGLKVAGALATFSLAAFAVLRFLRRKK